MNASIPQIFDQNMARLAFLENASAIGYELPLNGLWTASFTLPADDPKVEYCEPLNYVEIYDGETRIDLFRIVGEDLTRSDEAYRVFTCEHVLATLLNDVLFRYHQIGGTNIRTAQVLQYILDQQTTRRWVLSQCDFDRRFEYSWENTNLLAALLAVPKCFDVEYEWRWDTTVYPWQISLKAPNENLQAEIRYRKNLLGIKKVTDASKIVNRIYALGYGEGVNQLGIESVNNGLPYVEDVSSQQRYGVLASILADGRYTIPENLKGYAQQIMAESSVPYISYEVEGTDRFRLDNDDYGRMWPGYLCRVVDEADGITFEEPTEQLFSFNSPMGACPTCGGFGRVIGIDEQLVIPNTALSVYDGCVVCWRGEKMSAWRDEFIHIAAKNNFPIFTPYYELTQAQKDFLWHGPRTKPCIDSFFKMLEENQYKIQYRVMLARYRGKTNCPTCHGTRLKKEAGYVKVGGRSISELVDLPIHDLQEFFRNLQLDEHDAAIAKRILTEINNRIQFLEDVGLGYLTLNRLSNSLSGGESQRINLATSLGSSLVGSLYILDEPSIGLHSRDTDRLIKVLRQLQQLGNTVVVVEHDEEIIRAADYIIDIGPEGGDKGGTVIATGTPEEIAEVKESYTGQFLKPYLKNR